MKKIFALVDCNNFYASCERVFNPSLEGKPVIILSNNDGCVIARSNEAKKIGVKMGDPYFQCQPLCEKNAIHVFSSNYELYGDMSERVMTVLEMLCPEIEIYSVDEAFLKLDFYQHLNLTAYAKQVRTTIKQWTGMPVSIGMGASKTLAKIANRIAKKNLMDVFDFTAVSDQDALLKNVAVANIWGIGRGLTQRLRDLNIHNAYALKHSDPKYIRSHFSVVVEKIVYELRGEPCLDLDAMVDKKEIMSSRSFSKPVITLSELEEAVSHYAAQAAFKLRKQQSKAGGISVFIRTNPFKEDSRQYGNSITYQFENASQDTREIIHNAKICLKKIYKPNYEYKKAGVALFALTPDSIEQISLLPEPKMKQTKKMSQTTMTMLDKINAKMGKNTIFLCSEGTKKEWRMQRRKKSPSFTTNWNELPIVY